MIPYPISDRAIEDWKSAATDALAQLRVQKSEVPRDVTRRFMRAYLRLKALSVVTPPAPAGQAISLAELERMLGRD